LAVPAKRVSVRGFIWLFFVCWVGSLRTHTLRACFAHTLNMVDVDC